MNRKEFVRKGTLGLGALFMLPACEKFEGSPFENSIFDDKYLDNTAKNLAKLEGIGSNQTFSFAVIADTHNYYDEYSDCIDHINRNPDVKFVIHVGDLTDQGLQKEYIINQDILSKLKKPSLCAIGNHEYFQRNGESLFRTVYGATNYSTIIDERKFIFFDNNEGENNSVDYAWLDQQVNDGRSYRSLFVISHIPPYSYSYDDLQNQKEAFERIIAQPRVTRSIFGHEHFYRTNNEQRFLQVDYMKKRNYNIVTAHLDGSFSEKRVFF